MPVSSRNNNIPEALNDYIIGHSLRDRPALAALRDETAALPNAGMQISPDQGQLMALLVKATGTRRIVEVGTFTGYSALVMAQALPADGRLVACDVSAEYTDMARKHWEAAGVADRIDLRLGPAVETLDAMLAAGEAGAYDMAFIDADKENYPAYYEKCLTLLRAGGLVLVDNMLWGGRVADPAEQDETTVAIRQLTDRMHGDESIDFSLLPVGDGLALGVKR